ncbi:sensory rhodopsin transducer [Paenibacillus crassostreae]|uniref:Sensory rhodopsin transducer n=1 Tax=Paenibacillus crassostreae TaxID=1763538 RepID=A0A167CTX8_9BACL|nr:sensory rhodopsin transducer [Paenibacillus crassostreae]AOZ93550.1 hypothetical protein LPB68_16030 [Paenibacillus crassostreae]OAB73570.1 hypothetical protein PNBC_13760 [Paenibacillus crassostreae]
MNDVTEQHTNHSSRGSMYWVIPDGYIPLISQGELESHDSICVLNCGTQSAELHITIFFEDREPLENIVQSVDGRRTKHIRTATLRSDRKYIPKGVPYAIVVESSVPIIVQYSRLDSTQAELALMSVMAHPIS